MCCRRDRRRFRQDNVIRLVPEFTIAEGEILLQVPRLARATEERFALVGRSSSASRHFRAGRGKSGRNWPHHPIGPFSEVSRTSELRFWWLADLRLLVAPTKGPESLSTASSESGCSMFGPSGAGPASGGVPHTSSLTLSVQRGKGGHTRSRSFAASLTPYGTSTAAPSSRPARKSPSASLALSSG